MNPTELPNQVIESTSSKDRRIRIAFNGRIGTVIEWSKVFGYTDRNMLRRIRTMSLDDAMSRNKRPVKSRGDQSRRSCRDGWIKNPERKVILTAAGIPPVESLL